jgi:hypothetical protein
MELLLMALGLNASPSDVDSYLYNMGVKEEQREITFEQFYAWWSNQDESLNSRIRHK